MSLSSRTTRATPAGDYLPWSFPGASASACCVARASTDASHGDSLYALGGAGGVAVGRGRPGPFTPVIRCG